MLRRFLLGIAVVSLASAGWAGIVDVNQCVVDYLPGDTPVSYFVLPDGSTSLADALAASKAVTIDATITVTVNDFNGDPIPDYPREMIWLEPTGAGWGVVCGVDQWLADSDTDAFGQTTFTALQGGGCMEGELLVLVIGGYPVPGGEFDISINSADLNADGTVNILDSLIYIGLLGTTDYCGDYNFDGVVNILDSLIFVDAQGAACP